MDDNSTISCGLQEETRLSDLSNAYLLTLYDKEYQNLSPNLRKYIETRIPILAYLKEKKFVEVEEVGEL
jgi:hypothetical protein